MKAIACDTNSCFLCHSCLPQWQELTALKKLSYQYKRGEVIFREGEPVNGLFFTLNGAVKIHKHWGGQKELILRFAGGGDIIGLRGQGGTTVFPVSATALESTQACFISNEFLQSSLLANPSFTYKLMQFYAAELSKAEQRMSELAHSDVKSRIAGAVLNLEATFGVSDDGFVNLTISRQDIADYAGTSYETVFKTFTDWIKSALIQSEGKRIRVMDADGLRGLL